MRRRVAAAALGGATLVTLAGACRPERAAPLPAATPAPVIARAIEAPAAPGAAEPSLAASAGGRLILSWLEPRDGGRHALRFSSRGAGGPWSAPRTVAEGASWFVNWADFPRLAALPDGTLFAFWLEKGPGGAAYEYDVRLVRSTDGGATWSPPVHPYRDTTPSEHGFVSLAPTADGRAVRRDGTAGAPAVVARTSAARASGFPQMERAGAEVVMAWRDGREPAGIRTAVVEVGE